MSQDIILKQLEYDVPFLFLFFQQIIGSIQRRAPVHDCKAVMHFLHKTKK